MKKLSTFLTILMSFYGVMIMSPALAIADSHGNGHENNGHQSENHGSVVSAIARSHSEDGEDSNRNHGSMVSSVARDNHGHNRGEDNNDEDNEDRDDEDENDGGVTPPATTTLAISNLTASSTGITSETITWDTNKSADSKVYYSTTTPVVVGSFGTLLASSGTLLTHHQINLTGLVSGTTYYFIAVSADSSGTATSSQSSFMTPTQAPSDTTPPSIVFATNLGLNASTTRIIWVTNEASDSKVWFGTTTPVSTSTPPMASSSTFSFFHDLNLPGLATSTLYYYTISSTDPSGNTSFYSNSFTTPTI